MCFSDEEALMLNTAKQHKRLKHKDREMHMVEKVRACARSVQILPTLHVLYRHPSLSDMSGQCCQQYLA